MKFAAEYDNFAASLVGTEYLYLPEHTKYAIWDYVVNHRPQGDFITNLMSNNLRGTFSHADSQNMAAMSLIVRFVYNHVPAEAWGTGAKVSDWIDGH
jgi:hypothetical protein